MSAIEQHGGLAVRRRKLQAPGCGHVGSPDFGDDAGERPIPKTVLGHGKNLRVLAALRIKDAVGTEPDLLNPWRVKVEFRKRPKDGAARFGRKASSNAGCEKRGCRVIVQAGRGTHNLMETGRVETMISKAIVELREAECERWPPRHLGTGKLGAQSGELIGGRPVGEGTRDGH